MSFREEKLATARAGAAGLAAESGYDSVYLAGSLTAGLGNPSSDVDVFVLTRDASGEETRQLKIDGTRLDIEVYEIGWVDAALDKLATWTSSRTEIRKNALSEDELDVLLRMRESEVITDSADFTRIRERLGGGGDRLRQAVLSAFALEANSHLSDFRGAMEELDLDSAVLMGQSLMTTAGKALAAGGGDLYLGRKWVVRQLRRTMGDGFPLEEFRALQSGAWAERGAAGGSELVNVQQTLIAVSQLLGWIGADVNRWPFWALGAGADAYRRNPAYNTIHMDEGLLLNNELHRQFVVKPEIALIWALCNGREEDEIVAAALELSDCVREPGEQALTDARVRAVIGTLNQRGLISRKLFR